MAARERRISPGHPTQLSQVSREGTARGSPWRRLAEEPELSLWVIVFLLLTRQVPLSIPYDPAWRGGGQTSGSQGKAQPRGRLGPRATDRSVFISPRRLRQPWGCLPVCREGKGRGWGPQVTSSRTGHSLASLGRRVGHTPRESLSHKASLSLCLCSALSPTSGCREGRVAARSPHFGLLSLFSLTSFCSCFLLEPLLLKDENSQPPGKSSRSHW